MSSRRTKDRENNMDVNPTTSNDRHRPLTNTSTSKSQKSSHKQSREPTSQGVSKKSNLRSSNSPTLAGAAPLREAEKKSSLKNKTSQKIESVKKQQHHHHNHQQQQQQPQQKKGKEDSKKQKKLSLGVSSSSSSSSSSSIVKSGSKKPSLKSLDKKSRWENAEQHTACLVDYFVKSDEAKTSTARVFSDWWKKSLSGVDQRRRGRLLVIFSRVILRNYNIEHFQYEVLLTEFHRLVEKQFKKSPARFTHLKEWLKEITEPRRETETPPTTTPPQKKSSLSAHVLNLANLLFAWVISNTTKSHMEQSFILASVFRYYTSAVKSSGGDVRDTKPKVSTFPSASSTHSSSSSSSSSSSVKSTAQKPRDSDLSFSHPPEETHDDELTTVEIHRTNKKPRPPQQQQQPPPSPQKPQKVKQRSRRPSQVEDEIEIKSKPRAPSKPRVASIASSTPDYKPLSAKKTQLNSRSRPNSRPTSGHGPASPLSSSQLLAEKKTKTKTKPKPKPKPASREIKSPPALPPPPPPHHRRRHSIHGSRAASTRPQEPPRQRRHSLSAQPRRPSAPMSRPASATSPKVPLSHPVAYQPPPPHHAPSPPYDVKVDNMGRTYPTAIHPTTMFSLTHMSHKPITSTQPQRTSPQIPFTHGVYGSPPPHPPHGYYPPMLSATTMMHSATPTSTQIQRPSPHPQHGNFIYSPHIARSPVTVR